MICHGWIDTVTGDWGWQGDLAYDPDGTYTDATVTPAVTGRSENLAYLRIGKHEWGYLTRYASASLTRRAWLRDNPKRVSKTPTRKDDLTHTDVGSVRSP